MLEGKAVNASQVLNYYKHMVMIRQEAIAGIHSLKCWKLLFASGHDFLIVKNVKVLISVEVITKRESCRWGASFLCKDWMENQIAIGFYGFVA